MTTLQVTRMLENILKRDADVSDTRNGVLTLRERRAILAAKNLFAGIAANRNSVKVKP